jgi:hypothetical protein
MYTGTLIDDLIATVERAEEHLDARETREGQHLAYWHEAQTYEMKVAGQNLLGVA